MSDEGITLRLYRTHRDTLVSYAGKLSGDRVGAEDIVQDAWLLLDRKVESGVVREPLGYLRRIIRNLVFSQARQSRETVIAPEDMPDIADERPSAEAECMARQMMERVLDAIDAMPPRQRAAIKMYHFEEMKLREIAEKLGMSLSYTQTLITRGMEICNQCRRQGR
ncbi:MAG: sigma-70 family RNA polymerase sigma factor [Azospirillaceae bacterium]|nr:sigma-70 family RNA polymerase sigma factor [Azospirillaceae bacterium]